jgi:hypothetical protein
MSTTPKPPAQPLAIDPNSLPVSNPNNVTPIYSNHFGVNATMTDFTVFFLEVGSMPGPSGVVQFQEMRAAITLPMAALQGLKQVLGALEQQIEQAKGGVEKLKAARTAVGGEQ